MFIYGRHYQALDTILEARATTIDQIKNIWTALGFFGQCSLTQQMPIFFSTDFFSQHDKRTAIISQHSILGIVPVLCSAASRSKTRQAKSSCRRRFANDQFAVSPAQSLLFSEARKEKKRGRGRLLSEKEKVRRRGKGRAGKETETESERGEREYERPLKASRIPLQAG